MSRRQEITDEFRRILRLTVNTVVLVSALVVASIGLVTAWPIFQDLIGDSDTAELSCPGCELVRVTKVIEGDTFDSSLGRIRTYGYDTPEVGERCFDQATDRFKGLARGAVRVEQGERERDPFDRLLFYVYTEKGESIDEIMVKEGLAAAWTRDGQHKERLESLATRAESQEAGCLWIGRIYKLGE